MEISTFISLLYYSCSLTHLGTENIFVPWHTTFQPVGCQAKPGTKEKQQFKNIIESMPAKGLPA